MYRFQYELLINKEIYVIFTKFLPSVFTSFVSFLAAYLIFLKTKKKEETNKLADQEHIKKLLIISFDKKLSSFQKIESELTKFKDKSDEFLNTFFVDEKSDNYPIFNKAINSHLDYIKTFPEDKFIDKVRPLDLEHVYNICSVMNVLVIRTQFILNASEKSELPILKRYIEGFNDTIQEIDSSIKELKPKS